MTEFREREIKDKLVYGEFQNQTIINESLDKVEFIKLETTQGLVRYALNSSKLKKPGIFLLDITHLFLLKRSGRIKCHFEVL